MPPTYLEAAVANNAPPFSSSFLPIFSPLHSTFLNLLSFFFFFFFFFCAPREKERDSWKGSRSSRMAVVWNRRQKRPWENKGLSYAYVSRIRDWGRLWGFVSLSKWWICLKRMTTREAIVFANIVYVLQGEIPYSGYWWDICFVADSRINAWWSI